MTDDERLAQIRARFEHAGSRNSHGSVADDVGWLLARLDAQTHERMTDEAFCARIDTLPTELLGEIQLYRTRAEAAESELAQLRAAASGPWSDPK